MSFLRGVMVSKQDELTITRELESQTIMPVV